MKVTSKIKSLLMQKFDMKDLCIMKHYLGIDVDYDLDAESASLCQSNSTKGVLVRFAMDQC